MSNNQRLKELSKIAKKNKSVSVKELVEYFKVSDMTIRRDLKKLEENGLFTRFHGGIKYTGEDPLETREKYKIEEKKYIARYCTSIIKPQDTIILDAGTTTYQIALEMANSLMSKVTVITNSLKIAQVLQDVQEVNLIMCGGELRQASSALVGSISHKFFETIFANKAFVSTGGITENGFSTLNFSEGDIKRSIIQASESNFIVADSTKFGYQSLNTFSPLDSVTSIITSANISTEFKSTLD